MERIFDIAFRINGELSGSFGSAIANAQRQMRELNRRGGETQRNLSQTARAAQNLERLYATRNAVDKYKQLNQAVNENSAALVQARLRAAQLRQEHQQQVQQTERMRQSYDRLKAVYRESRSTMSADQQVAMQAQIRAAREELRAQEQRTRESGSASVGANRESTTLANRLRSQQSELAALRSSLTSAGVNLSEMAAHERELEESIRRTTQELERQQHLDNLRQRHNEASTNLSYARDNFQGALSTAQTIMSPFTDAVKTSMEFNAAMSEVKAISGATGKDFEALTAQAKELGSTTNFSATEAAAGMNN